MALAAVAGAAPALAGNYIYTAIGPPSAYVYPRGINDAGVVVGQLAMDRKTVGLVVRNGALSLIGRSGGIYTILLAVNQAGLALGLEE